MTDDAIVKHSLKDLEGKRGRSRRDVSPGPELGEEFWARAELVSPPEKVSVHLRVDSDILDFFRRGGKGHLTRMNAVLRAYVDAMTSDRGPPKT